MFEQGLFLHVFFPGILESTRIALHWYQGCQWKLFVVKKYVVQNPFNTIAFGASKQKAKHRQAAIEVNTCVF
jgi:hypothetical protein